MPPSSDTLAVRAKAVVYFAKSLLISQGFIWDWVLLFLLIRINRMFLKQLPHNQRYYSDNDPTLAYPMADCVLPHDFSWTFVFYITPAILLLSQLPTLWSTTYTWVRAVLDFHAAYLSLFEAYSVASTLKHILERSGKLRPDWLARVATGNASLIKDGRESYPSGHALYPTMASAILSLYLLGRTGVLARSTPGQFALFLLCVLPMVVAALFAMDRVDCYDHDFVDAVAGSFVGCVCGVLGYLLNFHSVMDSNLCGTPKERSPPIVLQRSHGYIDASPDSEPLLGSSSSNPEV